MPKITLILLKNCKNRPAMEARPQTSTPPADDPALVLRHYSIPDCALNYNRRFHVT